MKFIDLKNTPCWNCEDHDESKCEKCEYGDKTIFANTEYSGMDFVKEASWADFPDFDKYASPVFKFENGDRVVFDKTGLLIKLN